MWFLRTHYITGSLLQTHSPLCSPAAKFLGGNLESVWAALPLLLLPDATKTRGTAKKQMRGGLYPWCSLSKEVKMYHVSRAFFRFALNTFCCCCSKFLGCYVLCQVVENLELSYTMSVSWFSQDSFVYSDGLSNWSLTYHLQPNLFYWRCQGFNVGPSAKQVLCHWAMASHHVVFAAATQFYRGCLPCFCFSVAFCFLNSKLTEQSYAKLLQSKQLMSVGLDWRISFALYRKGKI